MSETDSRTLISLFHAAWREPARRDLPALADDSSALTYGELFEAVGALAGRLRAAGIGPGARVALAMARGLDLPVALLAVLAAGACPCVLEPRLGAEEVKRRFALAGLGWLLLDEEAEEDPDLAALEDVVKLPLDALPDAAPFWALDCDPDAPAFLLFTSGSSGKPKGVLQSHCGLLVNAEGILERTGLTTGDRLLHIMPLFHTNGVNNQVLAPLLAGSSVVLADRFKAEQMPGLLARHRPTILTGVPTIYSRMLAVDFPPESLASLRMLRCGSAPITEELHRRVEAAFGKPLVLSYGLSEATCTSTMNPPEARKIGSVGQALSGQQVYVADPQGRPLEGPGKEGEVCIAGPSLMLGYLEEGSGGKPKPPGPLLRSGDLGRFDAEGYLTITGRIKEVIIRGGENISPSLIESVLAKTPGVEAVCVLGKPDADLGEVPVAVIVRAQGPQGESLDAARLEAAVDAELSWTYRPADYHFLDKLPENAVGKVDRKALASQLLG